MAIIMSSCCCFDTVERGTVASAVYAMLTSILAFGWVTYRIQPIQALFQEMEGDRAPHMYAIYVSYIAAIVLTVCLIGSAMTLLVGTLKGLRYCLIPYLIVIFVTFVLQVPFTVFLLWNFIETNYVNLTVLAHFLFSVPLTAINIASFFCVIARFQQLTIQLDECDTKTDTDSLDDIKIDYYFEKRRPSQHVTILKKETLIM